MSLIINGVIYDIYVNNEQCDLDIFPSTPITNGTQLASSDNYILKDINGIYLTVNEYI